MRTSERLGLSGASRPSVALGALASLFAVAAATALVYPLAKIAPVAALGLVYIVGVLVVASVWGGWLGSITALASAAAFNWFHIPPTGRFTIAEAQNWVALAVFLVAALLASSLSERGRGRAHEAEQRRREADLAAEMARLLLRGTELSAALATLSHRLAQALGLPAAAIELGAVGGDERREAFALRDGDVQIATLLLSSGLDEPSRATLLLSSGLDEPSRERLVARVIPSLEALLAAALERETLQAEVVETAALRRSDVLKTALLRAVSHDLRSPLTAIVAASEALRSPLSRNEHEQFVADIVGEAERLSRLVDKLLDLSRLEADVAQPRTDWCSIEELLHTAAQDIGAAPDAFAFSLGADLPQVRADPAQLERAFANLLENARRHCGGHPVSVRARAVGDRLVVRIVDRGPGIAPSRANHIFEPFYRVEPDGSVYRGAGLGLAIVRGFVEANGGRVWVESLPGQGASFVVALPLERVSA
ncbi:MAG: two-component system, OmpR family, sensor histidine kinase KdpD [Solirubrobacteraceae bacterium]|nr:two-component system, OmpR family, sensor histidine kinase KdpD [Solirubrobacteraceae bacterium]